ncbi:MAG TPA: PKD domain-containing protein, partial [Solirubrobacteraceae bacterium]|nr:PKD domain-containing protein [Solirubrobacteraceae bacterium]
MGARHRTIAWVASLACLCALALPASALAGDLQTGPSLTSPQSCSSPCTIDVQAGTEVGFAAGGSGSFGHDGETLSMAWSWGDGTEANVDDGIETSDDSYSDNSSHVYTTGGTYALTVTVQDAYESSELSETFTIVVGSPPTLSLSASQQHPVVGEPVTYTGTASGTSSSPCTTCTY